jgi:hypothetical protein
MLKDVKMPTGQPATIRDIPAIQANIHSIDMSTNFVKKWNASYEQRGRFLEMMLPKLEKVYKRIPSEYQAQPARALQQLIAKKVKGSEALGEWMSMATEMALDYNAMIMAGPAGGAGTAGTGAEREARQDLLNPALPPKTFHGTVMGMKKAMTERLRSSNFVLNSLNKDRDKWTGGHSALVDAPDPDVPDEFKTPSKVSGGGGPYPPLSALTEDQLMNVPPEQLEWYRTHPEAQ